MTIRCLNSPFNYRHRSTKPIWHSSLCLGLSLLFAPVLVAQNVIVDSWHYTLEQPAEGWQKAEFDDSGWTEGTGGFGTEGTPGARVGTVWDTKQIWLRKTYQLDAIPAEPALMIHHDEDAEIY
ncbi:MAG: hypothetical protein ABI557_01905, partial [Aureliella sp.]